MPAARAGQRTPFHQPERYLDHNYTIAFRARMVRELVGPLIGKRVIDLGCGDGAVSRQFAADNEVTLLDRSQPMLEQARARTPTAHSDRVTFVNAPLESFVPAAPFDVVICLGVLAHVDALPESLAKIAELTREGGRAIIQLTDADTVLGRVFVEWCRLRSVWVNQMTLAEVVDLASRVGLRPLSERRHTLVLPGLQRALGGWLVPYDEFVSSRPALARHGADAIVLFEKAPIPR